MEYLNNSTVTFDIITSNSAVMMFIHLRYRVVKEFQEEVTIFHKEKVKVSDVLQRIPHLHTKNGIMKLYNEHGRLMKNKEKVEKARVYTLRRGVEY